MNAPQAQITRYQRWLHEQRGLHFDSYDALWRWSVDDLDGFWRSIWDYFEIQSPTPYRAVLDRPVMPGAKWFDGAQINYAQHLFSHAVAAQAAGHPAIVFADEQGLAESRLRHITWPELRRQVASCAAAFKRLGVQRGDRVCAVLPNVPETLVVFLACASLGAIWSVCSPDMGPVAVLDRFRQIEPKLLVLCDGYRYGGVAHDRRALATELLAALPTVAHVVLWRHLDTKADVQALAGPTRQAHDLGTLLADDVPFAPEWLAFDHPLWVVYSSGTTGLPKPIVHGHGGVMLEGLKLNTLHNDVGRRRPFPLVLEHRLDHVEQPGEYAARRRDDLHLRRQPGRPRGRQRLGHAVALCRGSPMQLLRRRSGFLCLVPEGRCRAAERRRPEPAARDRFHRFAVVARTATNGSGTSCPRWRASDIWLTPIAGGTDFAGAFIGGNRTLPVVAGEMQCRCLGAAVEAWSEPDANGVGQPLIDEVGELVCVKPMPSMPLYFWGDPGNKRYMESYFDMYPGIWRHGDWIRITPRGGAIIYGRSDATINRHGIRMGTSELYRAVEALPEVLDSLVVDLEYLGRDSWMPLFVVLRDGITLDDALTKRIKQVIREALSARHVPNDIFQVTAVPRTLSGKKMELPVKKLLMGAAPDSVLKRDAMANADCVDWFVELARSRDTPQG